MTFHDYADTTDEYDRDEFDSVVRLRSARQLIDDRSVPAWDTEEWAA
ncbi:hypothetical protein F5X71_03625 [Nocardia brasiliensis]|uniref:Uncharacterized protein n=1 Tax=Nocardia brasiliensis TaxID=37326 RepID=A0A6G9XKW3_NOCBR|nr:hypothetical protein [Nocardia brasiliensis]QIS01523.1 hypothetical protein F5X71_03625 [Nocardia brasiliensis]